MKLTHDEFKKMVQTGRIIVRTGTEIEEQPNPPAPPKPVSSTWNNK